MRPIFALSTRSRRLLAEDLVAVPEPLAFALEPGERAPLGAVLARAARAVLDLPEMAPQPPPWLARHQIPALKRLRAIVARYGGALLADAVGLGKSYVALALAMERTEPFTLVVPAVLVPQWKRLLDEKHMHAAVITHEGLSQGRCRSDPGRFIVVDEAHRFRNPETIRYRRLAELCIGTQVLLVTATPVHNRIADLFHLFRLFLRDDALTALGLGSLARAARGECDEEVLRAVASRLVVARSRARVGSELRFPLRGVGDVVRLGPARDATISRIVQAVAESAVHGRAAALLRLVLLRRLASSLAAFRATVSRYLAFRDIVSEAARSGRQLDAVRFQRLFPRGEEQDVQLSLLPLLLPAGDAASTLFDRSALQRMTALARDPLDPKALALDALLSDRGKTIVFTSARETARDLARRLRQRHRVATVTGASGWFGDEKAPAAQVLATFAPLAQGAAPPSEALVTDVLIATDLVSEGLNLQDAVRVVHYDLPWSPARLAQRVGRIDRLGSPHDRIATVTFLPPADLERATGLERRLSAKLVDQLRAGAAQRESTRGAALHDARLDWCDRLQQMYSGDAAPPGSWTSATAACDAVMLVVRVGTHVELLLVENEHASATPERAVALLARATPHVDDGDRARLDAAIRVAAPLVRSRIAALQAARWRADDRDRLARRLIPWVLTAARKAARAGDARLLGRLDRLVNRLALGMTAGEELALRDLVERKASLAVADLLSWSERLPANADAGDACDVQLVAGIALRRRGSMSR